MWFLEKVYIFVLSTIIATIDCSASNPENCTQAEKIYYGTYKFAMCEHWCYQGDAGWGLYRDEFVKGPQIVRDSDTDNYEEGANCSSSGYSTSCEYLRFLTQVCGSHYKVCHTQRERKPIMKMWIKQFIREIVSSGEKYEDDGLELRNGQCNDLLEEYFDKKEIDEISAMIRPEDIKETLKQTHFGNRYNNITIHPMGVLANADGSAKMPIPETSQIYKYVDRSRIDDAGMTLPSHWKYCDWKLNQDFKKRNKTKEYEEVFHILPDLWHCDGKCNTNEGDDQAWYKTTLLQVAFYQDLHDGKLKKEDYMVPLIISGLPYSSVFNKNHTNRGIKGCYFNTLYSGDDCQCYQNFLKFCLAPIDRCLGNIAIRELVLFAVVRFFKPQTCWTSNANCLTSNYMLTLLFILFHRAMYS